MLKYLPTVAFVCVLALFVTMASQALSLATEQPQKSDECPCPCCKGGELTLRKLTIKDGDGAGSVTIRSDGNGPGIWFTSPDGNQIAIAALKAQTALMVYSKADRERGGPCTLAVGMSGDVAVIQVRDKAGKVTQIPAEKLARAAAWLQTQPKDE